MKIGKYNITVVDSPTFQLDGGAIFCIIPKPLWNKEVECDEFNRIDLRANCLLLQSDKKNILVDTGIGGDWDEKFIKNIGISYSQYSIESSLASFNLAPSDITDVILTHLHFDHVGGAVKFEGEKILPLFENATYHVQKEQYNWAVAPSLKDKGSYIPSRFQPLKDFGVINFIEGEFQFDEEIKLIPSYGHTIAQQSVKISDGNKVLFLAGDILPTSNHIPLPYITGYDIQPLKTVEEKLKILSNAVEENWMLFFEHDFNYQLATVSKNNKGFIIKERWEKL